MKHLILILALSVLTVLLSCASQEAVEKTPSAALAAELEAERTSRDVEHEKKGEYQALSEIQLNEWNQRLGLLRAEFRSQIEAKEKAKLRASRRNRKAKRSAAFKDDPSVAPEMELALAEIEQKIREGRGLLAEMRAGNIDEYQDLKTKLDLTIEEIKSAFQKSLPLAE